MSNDPTNTPNDETPDAPAELSDEQLEDVAGGADWNDGEWTGDDWNGSDWNGGG